MPDSQSASERGESAKREKPREQGWRHLVVKSQVSDKAARRANARAASSERHFRMPFLPHRAKRGKRKIGRFSKTLENISLKCRPRSPYP